MRSGLQLSPKRSDRIGVQYKACDKGTAQSTSVRVPDDLPEGLPEYTGRELNGRYQERLLGRILSYYARKLFLPYPLRICYAGLKSAGYIWKGLRTLAKGRIEVPVLDGTAIAVSMLRGDADTAGSIMFLLGVGELLEEWTHKK